MTDRQEHERIKADFRRIRTLRRSLAAVLITYLPMASLIYAFRLPQWIFMSACALWVFMGIAIALRIGCAVCPVCRQYFHVRGLEGSTFAKECMNCGIRLNPNE